MKNTIRKIMTGNVAWDDLIYDVICNVALFLFTIVCFYPMYFILLASFTAPKYVNSGEFLLYPKEFQWIGYVTTVKDRDVWVGYGNTIIYVAGGTLLGVTVTMLSGYALSRKDMWARGFFMKIFVFTMYFGGGLIPTYLVISKLQLTNTRFLMILLGSVSVYNTIVVRSFMMSNIPDELYEAAILDGCGHPTFFTKVVIPLSKAIMSVIALWLAVGYWNSYFSAMIYLSDPKKYPLQLYLRQILIMASSVGGAGADPEKEELLDPEYIKMMQQLAAVLKYALIVVSTGPILCVYPFVQKYFVKGVMIGSVKG